MNAYIIDGRIYKADRAVLMGDSIKLYDMAGERGHGHLLQCIWEFRAWTTFEVLELN